MDSPTHPPRRRFSWFTVIILGSLAIHIFALAVLQPWAQTRMWFDTEAERQRTLEVAEREKSRKAMEDERRQRTTIPDDHAQDLIERERERHRVTLRDNVVELMRAREAVVERRDKALERVRQRSVGELLDGQLAPLRTDLRKAAHEAHQVTREPKFKEQAQSLKDQLTQAKKDLDELIRRVKDAAVAEETPPDHKALARDIADRAGEMAAVFQTMSDSSHGTAEGRSRRAANAARQLETTAKSLAGEIDADTLNDTESLPAIASTPEPAQAGKVDHASEAELYDAAVELEKQITEADNQTAAAEIALLEGRSVADALAGAKQAPPSRPELSAALDKGRPSSAVAADSRAPMTVGDFNAYREAIASATRETTDMTRRAERQAGVPGQPDPARRRAMASGAEAQRLRAMQARSTTTGKRRVINMIPLQMAKRSAGTGTDLDMDLRAASGGGGEMVAGTDTRTVRLKGSQVAANALPGRMLTDDTARAGFLFLDTWYMIGPWDNWARADFQRTHPPEQGVDLDAVYTDGKFKGQKLRWHFVQSDRIAIQPPKIHHSATYYAFTEVYTDRTREMLVAVASDDMAKLWLNGDIIWTDHGQSGWNLDEGFRRVIFREGFNTVLVRIENGPTYCAFSVLLCPPEAVEQ
jgi:hypothetical protein